MINNENIPSTTETNTVITNVQENGIERVDTEEDKLRREMEVGEHDIVIEEDFQINLDVATVSDDANLFSEQKEADNTPGIELASEQSGNITF